MKKKEEIQVYLQRLKIDKLKQIQVEAISLVRKGLNFILLSPTGSGKTLAFLLPVIKFLKKDSGYVQALILVPSRELALQIGKVFKEMQTGMKATVCYGGHPFRTEVNDLTEPPVLLIGTPGRIADHLRRETFNSSKIEVLILDEFDKSLELGFSEEMKYIINSCSNINTRILTSATGLNEIPEYIGMNNPVTLDYTNEKKISGPLTIRFVRSENNDKLEELFKLICHLGTQTTIIFCNHREAVDRISELLSKKGISHGTYHGGMEQERRELSLIRFRNGSHRVLLTTDLASRGIDVPGISNVIHYQLPASEKVWIHRNGRTARMEKDGTAWLVLAKEDYVPDFIKEGIDEFKLAEELSLPIEAEWVSLYFGAGKKDKISRGDIAGFLFQKGALAKDEVGRIDVLDHASFAAVKRNCLKPLQKRISGERIKNKMVKIELAN